MIELDAVKGFDWDAGNARKNVDGHGVSQTEAEQIFMNEPLIVANDTRHSGAEQRYHGLGQTNENRRLHVTFTLRRNGLLIRVISARDMSRKERRIYDEES